MIPHTSLLKCSTSLAFTGSANLGPAQQGFELGRTSMTVLKAFLRDESGATAIEYGLIAAGISVAIITVVGGLGTKLNSTFTSVKNGLN